MVSLGDYQFYYKRIDMLPLFYHLDVLYTYMYVLGKILMIRCMYFPLSLVSKELLWGVLCLHVDYPSQRHWHMKESLN